MRSSWLQGRTKPKDNDCSLYVETVLVSSCNITLTRALNELIKFPDGLQWRHLADHILNVHCRQWVLKTLILLDNLTILVLSSRRTRMTCLTDNNDNVSLLGFFFYPGWEEKIKPYSWVGPTPNGTPATSYRVRCNKHSLLWVFFFFYGKGDKHTSRQMYSIIDVHSPRPAFAATPYGR